MEQNAKKEEGKLVAIPEELVENLIKFLGDFKYREVEHLIMPLRIAPVVRLAPQEPTTMAKPEKSENKKKEDG